MTFGWRLWLETLVIACVFIGWTMTVWQVARQYYEVERDVKYIPPMPPKPCACDDEDQIETLMLVWPTDGRRH